MTTIFEKPYICPKCNTAFTGTTIGSCGHADKWSDLMPVFWGADPRMFFLACCPDCGHCDFADQFEDGAPEMVDMGGLVDPGGTPTERYAKAYKIALDGKKTNRELADYALQAAWCRHDENEDTEDFRKLREAAVYYFESSFPDGDVKEEETLTTNYLIAELSRQNGDFEKTYQYLDKIPAESDWAPVAAYCRARAEEGDTEPYVLGEADKNLDIGTNSVQ